MKNKLFVLCMLSVLNITTSYSSQKSASQCAKECGDKYRDNGRAAAHCTATCMAMSRLAEGQSSGSQSSSSSSYPTSSDHSGSRPGVIAQSSSGEIKYNNGGPAGDSYYYRESTEWNANRNCYVVERTRIEEKRPEGLGPELDGGCN